MGGQRTSPEPAEISIERIHAEVVRLRVRGEWDAANVDGLETALAEALDVERGVIVDLTSTAFADSSVIHALIAARHRAQGEGKAVVIQLGTESVVRRVLEVSGILSVIPSSESPSEAIRLASPAA